MRFVLKPCALLISAGIAFSRDDGSYFSKNNGHYECPNWPSLLVLGAQKAGTTSLFTALMAHPNTCDAKIDENDESYFNKEVHFFDYRYHKGSEFYCSRFTTCAKKNKFRSADAEWIDKALHVDCTPNYLYFGIAQRMKETFSPEARKNMKVIAILREPVARMLSWYDHLRYLKNPRILRKSYENATQYSHILYKNLTQYSDIISESYSVPQGDHLNKHLNFREFALIDKVSVGKGQYIDILEEYFDVFSKENMLVLNYDFMMENQRETLSLVSKFIGINDMWDLSYSFPHVNKFEFSGKVNIEDIDCQFLKELSSYYRPYNTKMYNILFKYRNQFWSDQPHFRQFNVAKHFCEDENKFVYV